MALRFYPALIEQAEGDNPEAGYGVVFPDLPGCISSGETVQEAAINAAEALSLHIEGMAEDGLPIPPPGSPDAPLPDWLADVAGKLIARVLVPVDMPGRAIRANITLDEGLLSRLDAAAAAEGTSRSGYIAQAVRQRLQAVHAPRG
jgi:predicted RNase H-like HicB family nuclease